MDIHFGGVYWSTERPRETKKYNKGKQYANTSKAREDWGESGESAKKAIKVQNAEKEKTPVNEGAGSRQRGFWKTKKRDL